MNNLAKKSLTQSTVFQYGMILNLMATALYVADPTYTAAMLASVWLSTFGAYTAKEGIAKGAEAYRDRGAP